MFAIGWIANAWFFTLCIACTAPNANRVSASGRLPASPEPSAAPTVTESENATSKESTASETSRLHELDIVDFNPALLWVPGGSTPHPLLIVAHGAGGTPEWHCDFWTRFVAAHAFVLCLRGRSMSPHDDAFYFPEHHYLGRLIDAALERVEAEHAERLAKPYVYVAYSQGATMGALALPELQNTIPLALFTEGGYQQWPVFHAKRYAAHGGRRVYFACGTSSCRRGAERSVRWLRHAGLEADFVHVEGMGHTPAGAVGEAARAGLVWLTNHAAAWSDLTPTTDRSTRL